MFLQNEKPPRGRYGVAPRLLPRVTRHCVPRMASSNDILIPCTLASSAGSAPRRFLAHNFRQKNPVDGARVGNCSLDARRSASRMADLGNGKHEGLKTAARMMGSTPRQRLRWWLRAERALGLRYIHAPGLDLQSVECVPPHSAHPMTLAPEKISKNLSAPTTLNGLTISAPARATGQTARPSVLEAGKLPTPPFEVPMELPGTREAFTSRELSAAEKTVALQVLDETQVKGCTRCNLCRTRRNTVFGEGDSAARVMFIGEGPGGTEDQTGRPFVGRSGQKLTEMIQAMGLKREQVYICNVVKCRAFLQDPSPKDRPPEPAEAAACRPYLEQQIKIVRPDVIVTLGLSAMRYLLGVNKPMSIMRGKWKQWRGIPVMPTFHPSYILRIYTPETRRAVWLDLQAVMERLKQPSHREQL